MVRLKEKVREVIVQKVIRFTKKVDGVIKIEEGGSEGGGEGYLYEGEECAIVGFEISSKEEAAVHMRHSNLVFVF